MSKTTVPPLLFMDWRKCQGFPAFVFQITSDLILVLNCIVVHTVFSVWEHISLLTVLRWRCVRDDSQTDLVSRYGEKDAGLSCSENSGMDPPINHKRKDMMTVTYRKRLEQMSTWGHGVCTNVIEIFDNEIKLLYKNNNDNKIIIK